MKLNTKQIKHDIKGWFDFSGEAGNKRRTKTIWIGVGIGMILLIVVISAFQGGGQKPKEQSKEQVHQSKNTKRIVKHDDAANDDDKRVVNAQSKYVTKQVAKDQLVSQAEAAPANLSRQGLLDRFKKDSSTDSEVIDPKMGPKLIAQLPESIFQTNADRWAGAPRTGAIGSDMDNTPYTVYKQMQDAKFTEAEIKQAFAKNGIDESIYTNPKGGTDPNSTEGIQNAANDARANGTSNADSSVEQAALSDDE